MMEKQYKPAVTVQYRKMSVPKETQTLGVQSDILSEMVEFRVARYYTGFDLSTKQWYVDTLNEQGQIFDRSGLQVVPTETDPDKLSLWWVVGRLPTSTSGAVKVRLMALGDDFLWQTEPEQFKVADTFAVSDPPDPPGMSYFDSVTVQVQEAAQRAEAAAREVAAGLVGANLTGVAWHGVDMRFAKGDGSTIDLVGAKTDLTGTPGINGWTPILAVVTDGARRVYQVTDWTGGTGDKPATGQYVGPSGYVADIGQAVDIRGGTGATGIQGIPGAPGAVQSLAVDSIARVPDGSGIVDLSPDFARYALLRKTTPAPIAQVYPVPGSPLDVTVQTVATQAGSGLPGTDNVRPIVPVVPAGGNVKVLQRGKNLLDGSAWRAGFNIGEVLYAPPEQAVPTAETKYLSIWMQLRPGTYTLSWSSEYSFSWNGYAEQGIAAVQMIGSLSQSITFTVAFGGWVGIRMERNTSPSILTDIPLGAASKPSDFKMQVEYGSVATPYEPYQGAEHTLTPQQPLYGLPGAEDWIGNDGSEGHGSYIHAFTGLEDWASTGAGQNLFFRTLFSNGDTQAICSHFTGPTPGTANAEIGFGCVSSAIRIRPNLSQIPTTNAFKSWLAAQHAAGRPVQVLCVPALPLVLTNPAITIPALLQPDKYTPQINTISSDAGTVEVGHAKSLIRESDELQAAIAALA